MLQQTWQMRASELTSKQCTWRIYQTLHSAELICSQLQYYRGSNYPMICTGSLGPTFRNDRRGEISSPLPSLSPPLPSQRSLCPLPQMSHPSCLFPFPFPFSLLHPLNPSRRSGERCKLPADQDRAQPPNASGAFSGWNLLNFFPLEKWHIRNFYCTYYCLKNYRAANIND